jgi:uncharacterized membrane protein
LPTGTERPVPSGGVEDMGEPTARIGLASFDSVLHWLAFGFEACGVLAIVLALLFSLVQAGQHITQGRGREEIYHRFRTTLARGILLGLEFLIAADIMGTVAIEPALENLLILGLIILIRTFLSFALELEITGRWPWQAAAEKRPTQDD